MVIKCNTGYLHDFVGDHEWEAMIPQMKAAHETLHGRSGLGNDFLGWMDLPVAYDKEEFARIQKAAEKIKNDSEVLIVIGIGGSYLGARAVIEPRYITIRKRIRPIFTLWEIPLTRPI